MNCSSDLRDYMKEQKNIKLINFTNEPPANNAGGFRRLAFNKPANNKGKVNIE